MESMGITALSTELVARNFKRKHRPSAMFVGSRRKASSQVSGGLVGTRQPLLSTVTIRT